MSSCGPKYRFQYEKCRECRRDKKKCQPYPREWPAQKCNRCVEKDLPCSGNETSVGSMHIVNKVLNQIQNQRDRRNARDILRYVAFMFFPLSAGPLSKLLQFTDHEVDRALNALGPILDTRNDRTNLISLNHASYRDFLLKQNNWIDASQTHQSLFASCIRLLSSSLKQDIFGLDTPGALVTDIQSTQLEQCLPPETQYACLCWGRHLQESAAQLSETDHVYTFLREHALHWLEAMSWMGKISEAMLIITELESTAFARGSLQLRAFIGDINRFMLYNRAGITQAPLQIYIGALLFTPTRSLVRKEYATKLPQWIQRAPDVPWNWDRFLATFDLPEVDSQDPVRAVAFSPSGRVVAVAVCDTVMLWHLWTGESLQTVGYHKDVSTIAFSPDGKHLTSASEACGKLWGLGKEGLIRTLSFSHRGNCSTISPDGSIVATTNSWGDHDGVVELWDIATGRELETFRSCWSRSYVAAIAFSHDGILVASATYDGTVALWGPALQGNNDLLLLDGYDDGLLIPKDETRDVTAVAISHDCKLVASVFNKAVIKLWNTATGATLRTEITSEEVNGIVISLDGKWLATLHAEGQIMVWDTTSQASPKLLIGHSGRVSYAAFSPDGMFLASAAYCETVRLWDLNCVGTWQSLGPHMACVNALAFSPDQRLLASAAADGEIKLWESVEMTALRTLQHNGSVKNVVFSPDSKVLASVVGGTAQLWDVATGEALCKFRAADQNLRCITAVAFSPNNKLLLSCSDWLAHKGGIRLCDSVTGVTLQTFDIKEEVKAVALGHDGKLAAVSHGDKISLWNPDVGISRQLNQGGPANAVAFSNEGKLLVSTSADRSACLWDVVTGEALQRLQLPAVAKCVSFSGSASCMETDRGLVEFSRVSNTLSWPTLQGNIFVEERWITCGARKLIWLPFDYRPSCVAVRGNIVILGHRSGRLSIIGLAA